MKKEYPRLVKNAQILVDWFGYWPSFHDAEVLWVSMERGKLRKQGDVRVEMMVYVYEISPSQGVIDLQKDCLVDFVFENCAVVKLDGFNQQNQVWGIEFTVEKQVLNNPKIVPVDAVVQIIDGQQQVADEVLKVSIEGEFGLEGEFKCSGGRVESVTACDAGEYRN